MPNNYARGKKSNLSNDLIDVVSDNKAYVAKLWLGDESNATFQDIVGHIDGGIVRKGTIEALDAATTLTLKQIASGHIKCTPTAARTYTLPTAAILVASIEGVKVGDYIDFTIDNRGGAGDHVTLAAGVGGTVFPSGTDLVATVGTDEVRNFRVLFTNVTAASEAYDLINLDAN